MAAPVATARTLNGVQDTPIDSDDAPYYRATTAVIIPFGFAGNLVAQVPFVAQATRGEIVPIGYPPQGVFVGAFVKQATRGDIDPFGLTPSIIAVGWLTIPTTQIDRSDPIWPKYINNVRATYLVDPGAAVMSVSFVDATVSYHLLNIASTIPGSIQFAVTRDGTLTVTGQVIEDWAHPKSATVGDIYEAKMTTISGALTSGTVGSYLPLTSNRTWTLTSGIAANWSGTLVIRRVGGNDLDSKVISMQIS